MKRLLRVPVGLAVAALAVVPVAAALAQQSGTVSADKEGWWSRLGRAAPVGVPETVPTGAIAIAARAGQPEKVAALGIVVDAARGSTVEVFTLTLREAEGTGAQQNSGGAAIVACPIIDFFAADSNGAFEDAPAADCDAAQAEGTRSDDGTWAFDLLPIADAWLDPFGTIAANGIRLDPGDGTFQVSLTGMEDARFDVSLSAPQEDSDPFDAVTTTVPGGFGGSSGGSPVGGFETAPPPDVAAPVDDGGEAAPATPVEGDEPAEEDSAPAVSRAGDVAGNLPGGFPLVFLLLGLLAGAIMVTLGPVGRQRSTVARRSGGVSRALDAHNPGAQT